MDSRSTWASLSFACYQDGTYTRIGAEHGRPGHIGALCGELFALVQTETQSGFAPRKEHAYISFAESDIAFPVSLRQFREAGADANALCGRE